MKVTCPPLAVGTNLCSDNNDENGGNHGAEQVVVRQHLAQFVRLVVIGTYHTYVVGHDIPLTESKNSAPGGQ
jgi:hypothetical protein